MQNQEDEAAGTLKQLAARFQSADGLNLSEATAMTQSLSAARYYQAARDAGAPAKLVADWMMSELARHFTAGMSFDESAVDALTFAALLRRIQDGTISPGSARDVLDDLWQRENKTPGAVDATIDALGLKRMKGDADELEMLVNATLTDNAILVTAVHAGNEEAFNGLVGQTMKVAKGKVNPAEVGALLRSRLALSATGAESRRDVPRG
jgi:aspartyl-tRNA(Asn)/glutamyl-tRNA(Gln) amidotransferase subunit B